MLFYHGMNAEQGSRVVCKKWNYATF